MLRTFFFESPYPVILVAGLAELITVAIWQKRRVPHVKVMLAVWPLVAVAIGILAHVVETDQEKIAVLWQDMKIALDQEDVDAILAAVSDDFQSGRDFRNSKDVKADLRRLAQRGFKQLGSDSIGVTATGSLTKVDENTYTGRTVVTHSRISRARWKWKITFSRQDDGRWLISSAISQFPKKGITLRSATNML